MEISDTGTPELFGEGANDIPGLDDRRGYPLHLTSRSQSFTCYDERQLFTGSGEQHQEGGRVLHPLGHEVDDMSFSSSSDDPETAAAVVQQFDGLLRQRLNMEMDMFKENIQRILTDQHLQFRQAFGLPETPPRSQTEPMHVVPQSNHCEDNSSEECQILTEGTESDTSDISVHRHQSNQGEQPLQSHINLKGDQGYNWAIERISEQQSHQDDLSYENYQLCDVEHKCTECNGCGNSDEALTKCLVRMFTASSAVSEALRRH